MSANAGAVSFDLSGCVSGYELGRLEFIFTCESRNFYNCDFWDLIPSPTTDPTTNEDAQTNTLTCR